MRHSERRSRIAGAALGVVVTSAVAAWALAHATTRLAPAVALAGIAGIVTFVVGALGEAVSTRASVLAISGAVLFCAAEVANRSIDQPRHVEHRPGVERWSPAWVLGVAAGSAGLSYGAIAARGLLAGGGPAALAAGGTKAISPSSSRCRATRPFTEANRLRRLCGDFGGEVSSQARPSRNG